MPLQSNAKTSAGVLVLSSSHGPDQVLQQKSMDHTFIVSPSPCVNGTGRKLPGEYNFARIIVKYPRGTARYSYYAHINGTRQRVESTQVGVFQSVNIGDMSLVYTNMGSRHSLGITEARNRAINKLYSEIQSSDINLSTTIGEGRESFHLIAAIARSVRHPLKALRSAIVKKRKGAVVAEATRATIVTVSQLQLAWSVGLKPLLSDIKALQDHIQKQANPPDLFYHAKSRASFRAHDVEVQGPNSCTIDYSHRFQIGVDYVVGDPGAFELWRSGLVLRPTTAWELTRLSWVVDYFLQIGNFLAAWEAAHLNNGMSLHSGYETVTIKKDANWNRSLSEPDVDTGGEPSRTCILLELLNGSFSEVRKTRSRLTSFPSQAHPTIKLPTASTQLLNCAALLGVLLKK